VRHSCNEVVTIWVKEDLCLVFQTPECLAVNDPITISLEGCSEFVGGLVFGTAPRLVRLRGQGCQQLVLETLALGSKTQE